MSTMTTKSTLAAAALSFVAVGSVHATPVTGSIGFAGAFTQNGGVPGNLSTATSMTVDTVSIITTSGDLVGATSPIVFASPIGVNGHAPSLVGGLLWSVKDGGVTYSFTVSTESETFVSVNQLNLTGVGTLSDGNPGDNSYGEWQLGFGKSGEAFTWQSTSANSVPEPATLSLLGLGLGVASIGLARRKGER